MEFEINFTDLTLLEANGEFEEVNRLMSEPIEMIGGIKSPVPSDKWVVKSTVTISHAMGFGSVICDFYHDGKIIIISYFPSSKDLYSIDIRCLSAWASSYGWKKPEPISYIIDEWKDFWVMQWETHVIDSEFLDRKIGPRGAVDFMENPPEDEDDDEDDLYEDNIKIDDNEDLDKYR